MRDAFVRTLTALCSTRSDIVLLSGDLGFGVLNEFRRLFPSQFLNVGVAEQNLAGVGAGLALAGHVVFTYSIANFPTLRCLEQIRNDICYHQANVKIVAIGGGMAYGALGASHFAIEDLGVMRLMPNMTVVAPADPTEVEALLPHIVAKDGPVYLRLGRAGEPRLFPSSLTLALGDPNVVRDGEDVLLLSTGGIHDVARGAADLLEDAGLSVGVASVPTVRPLPDEWLRAVVARYRLVVTCEEHSVVGGLGGAVAEVMASMDKGPRLERIGLPSAFPSAIGSQEFLRRQSGLDSESIAMRISSKLVCA